MKYCYSCGHAISGNEKFCPKCGQRLIRPTEPALDNPLQKTRDCACHGVIFTDLCALAELLGSDRKSLEDLLEKYSDSMVDSDIDYRIVDVSEYTFVSDGAGRKGRKVSLAPGNPWWEYQHVLYDIVCYEKENSLPESTYLFIVGGHEVIPVPTINHYLKDDPSFRDKDIETDILYSFPYGPHTRQALESTELYMQEMYFFAGRLPVPKGCDVSYLVNYLQNALDSRGGIPVRKIYAQTDPHWKELTAWIMDPYNQAGLLPDRSNISGHYSYGNVMLGPDVTSEHIHSVMDMDTDFIYLNLHGSDNPYNPGYAGEYPPNTRRYIHIFPLEAMKIPSGCNVFVTEACYGGRHVGYDVEHSMIQAGFAHKTVIGLASSRIAFGGFRAPGGNADTICGVFTACLLGGCRAGDAFMLARSAFFGEDGMLDPYRAATLAEFNLYGDPSLRAAIESEDDSEVAAVSKNMAPENYQCGYEMETIKSDARPQSLLEQIRGAVDANIMAISRKIADELYSHYGLSPREPETVRKVKFHNGKYSLFFTYKNGDASWVVASDAEGKIESVMTTK